MISKNDNNRIYLRKLHKTDLEEIYLMSKEKDLMRFLPDQHYETKERAGQVIDFLISQYESKDIIDKAYVLGVIEKATEKIIGHVGLSPVKFGIEIGYAIRDSHKHQGFATDAVRSMLAIAKQQFNLKEVLGIVDIANTVSIKVLKKSGFKLIDSGAKKLTFSKIF